MFVAKLFLSQSLGIIKKKDAKMAQYKGASREAHRARTLEKRRERQKEEMELLKNKLSKVKARLCKPGFS